MIILFTRVYSLLIKLINCYVSALPWEFYGKFREILQRDIMLKLYFGILVGVITLPEEFMSIWG